MNIILSGACGRMGEAIAEKALSEIVCGVDKKTTRLPFPLFDSFEKIPFPAEIVIDFSSPETLQDALAFCIKARIPLLLGTTGHSAQDLLLIKKAAGKIPVMQSGNFSLGANLLCRLARQAAAILSGWDAEIVERHHRQKKDAPSGTAVMLAESVLKGFGGGESVFCPGEERKKGEVGIHSLRGGTIVGEHEVMFAGEDEILTLSHSARDRAVFASGALRAAKWLVTHPAGLYHMDDLLSDLIQKG